MKLEDKFKSKELPGGYTLEELNELTNDEHLNRSEAISDLWKNEIFKEVHHEAMINAWKDPEKRENHRKLVKDIMSTDTMKNLISEKTKEVMNTSEMKEKIKKAMSSDEVKKRMSDEGKLHGKFGGYAATSIERICPTCKLSVKGPAFFRYHGVEGEKCKKS